MRRAEDVRQQLEKLAGPVTPEELEWLEEERYLMEAEQSLLTVRELGDVLAAKRASGGSREPRAQRGLTAAHLEAISALKARDAERVRSLAEFRTRELGGNLIETRDVADWIEARREPGTLYQEVADDGTVVGWYRKPLRYAVEGSPWAVSTETKRGGVLDRLRMVSEDVSRSTGWREAHATVFVLTGRAPLVSSIRVTVRRSSAGDRIMLDCHTGEDPEVVAAAFRSARAEEWGGVKRPNEQTACLARFAVENKPGTWDDRRKAWNAEHPEWRYCDRRSFQKAAVTAATRALAA